MNLDPAINHRICLFPGLQVITVLLPGPGVCTILFLVIITGLEAGPAINIGLLMVDIFTQNKYLY